MTDRHHGSVRVIRTFRVTGEGQLLAVTAAGADPAVPASAAGYAWTDGDNHAGCPVRDRTMAGLSAARARGRNGGRPSKLSPDQVRAARRLYDEREHTVEQIGGMFGVSRTSIYRALRDKHTGAKPDAGGEVRRPRRSSPAGRNSAS